MSLLIWLTVILGVLSVVGVAVVWVVLWAVKQISEEEEWAE